MEISWEITGVVWNALATNVTDGGQGWEKMSGVLSGEKKKNDRLNIWL